MKGFVRGSLAAATIRLALFAAGSLITEPAWAADVQVMIDNFTFGPQRITVSAGTKVTWRNRDDIPHTVTSSAKLFKSKVLDTDDEFSFAFTTPGMYEYFCSLHPHMTGTVAVEARTGSNAAQ